MRVFRSMVLNAPVAAGLGRGPGLRRRGRLESGRRRREDGVGDPDQPSAPFAVSTSPTARFFRETLLAHSDLERLYAYDIVEGPLPCRNYVIDPPGSSRSPKATGPSASGRGTFDCNRDDEAKLDDIVGERIYVAGMNGTERLSEERAIDDRHPGAARASSG